MADPNSRHQLWSKWTITIRPNLLHSPIFNEVKVNTARFMRKAFGSGAMCRIDRFPKAWVVQVLADSHFHPDDDATLSYMTESFITFFRHGFGPQAGVSVKARLMAGERLDGRPPDQLIILPRLNIRELLEMH